MTIINSKFSRMVSNTSEIFAEIEKHEFARRKEAAKLAAKVMRKNISSKGNTPSGSFPSKRRGDLHKSIGYRMIKHDRSAAIGSKSFKAHFLEFGHGDGKERNKKPFIFPSLKQAEPDIIKVMSEPYF